MMKWLWSAAPEPIVGPDRDLAAGGLVVWTWLTFNSPASRPSICVRWRPCWIRTRRPPRSPAPSPCSPGRDSSTPRWRQSPCGRCGRRLRRLAVALLLVIALAWGGVALLKISFQRPRPQQALDLLTTTGYAYPSGHMTGVVAMSIAVGATLAVTRQSFRARIFWHLGSGLLVLAVAVDRWIIGGHYITDIGGALYGSLAATAALLVAGVRVPISTNSSARSSAAAEPSPREAAPSRQRAGHLQPGQSHRLDHLRRTWTTS